MNRIATVTLGIGGSLLVIVITCFALQTPFFGMNNLILERIGIALAYFSFGLKNWWVAFIFLLVMFGVAAVLDPIIWNLKGLDIDNIQTFSWMINGEMALIGSASYVLGYILKNKMRSH